MSDEGVTFDYDFTDKFTPGEDEKMGQDDMAGYEGAIM